MNQKILSRERIDQKVTCGAGKLIGHAWVTCGNPIHHAGGHGWEGLDEADIAVMMDEMEDASDELRVEHIHRMHEFEATCERCRRWKRTCQMTPIYRPMPVTPPETEPLIGPGYITERVIIDPDDLRVRAVIMCRTCRKLKEKFVQSK